MQVAHYQLHSNGCGPAIHVCATREADMDALAQFAVLTFTTIFAGILALGMAWAFLRGAFHLMRPVAARQTASVRLQLVHGTRAAVRGLGRS